MIAYYGVIHKSMQLYYQAPSINHKANLCLKHVSCRAHVDKHFTYSDNSILCSTNILYTILKMIQIIEFR